MLRDSEFFKKFEDDFIKSEGWLSFEQAIALFAGMWKDGVRLGVLPPKRRINVLVQDVSFASPEDLIIHKIFAGRPGDIEDARIIILKNPALDYSYQKMVKG